MITPLFRAITPALFASCLMASPAAAEDYLIGHAQGDVDAPITLIEYGSLTCGGCKYFHDKIMPTVEEDYIATGKVRFIFREVLRNDLDTALVAIARCAGPEQFFDVVDDTFERQDEILAAAGSGTVVDKFISIGTPYGITDKAAFDTCYGDMNIRFDIIEVEQSAEAYTIKGTPTLVVNGTEKYVDADFSSGEAFSAYLDQQLAALPGPADTEAQ